MIKIDKNNNDYVLVSNYDILTAISHAKNTKNDKMFNLLNEVFISIDNECEIDNSVYKKFKRNDVVLEYLKNEVKIENYDNYIDHNVLKDAFSRAYLEFNHEMKKKLSNYFRKYVENEIDGIDNTYLEEEIKNDKIVMNYIKKYENFTEYLKDKRLKNKEIEKMKKYVQ